MNKLTTICLLLFASLFFSGCKKKSKKWLVAKIQVTDQVTGEGIKSSVQLRYRVSGMLGTGPEQYIDLGETDEYGNMEIEQSISRKYIGLELDIRPAGYYYLWHDGGPLKSIPVYAKASNVKHIQINPIYPYHLSLKNLNCSGPTDSVWVDLSEGGWGGTNVLTGCVDTTFNYFPNSAFAATSPTEKIHFVSKKNGILDSGTISPNYIHGQITHVMLEY